MYIVYLTLANGPACAANPWRKRRAEKSSPLSPSMNAVFANTFGDLPLQPERGYVAGLEWSLPSPPAFHTFGDSLPVIRPSFINSPSSKNGFVFSRGVALKKARKLPFSNVWIFLAWFSFHERFFGFFQNQKTKKQKKSSFFQFLFLFGKKLWKKLSSFFQVAM